LEDIIYHCLEYGQTVSHTKEHYQGLEQSMVGTEHGLLFISRLDIYIVKAPVNIKLGEVLGFIELRDKFRYQRKKVLVFDYYSIERVIVLD